MTAEPRPAPGRGGAPTPRDRRAGDLGPRLLDLPGVVLFGVAVTLPVLTLTTLPRPPWPLVTGLIGCLLVLVLAELHARSPSFDVRMLAGNPWLVVAYPRVLLTLLVVYGVLFDFTPWLRDDRGLSASAAGGLLLGMSAVGTVASPFAVRESRLRWSLLVPALGLLAGSLALTVLDAATPIALLALVAAAFGLPNGMGQVANQIVVYRSAPQGRFGTATGLSRTAQCTGAMLAASVTGPAYAGGVDVAARTCSAGSSARSGWCSSSSPSLTGRCAVPRGREPARRAADLPPRPVAASGRYRRSARPRPAVDGDRVVGRRLGPLDGGPHGRAAGRVGAPHPGDRRRPGLPISEEQP